MPETAEERTMGRSSSSSHHYDERRFHVSAAGVGPGRQLVHGEHMHDVLSPQGLPLKGALWNKDTDLVLRDLVLRSEVVDWVKIASTIEWDTGKNSAEECQRRWETVKDTPVKGPWSAEEDEHLKRLVEHFGYKKWNLLAKSFPGRSGKQCRERWHNHVDERVKKGEWTAEEDQILCEAQRQLGNKWSEMSRILTGRSENAIKNRFNSLNAKGLTETRANELLARAGATTVPSSRSGDYDSLDVNDGYDGYSYDGLDDNYERSEYSSMCEDDEEEEEDDDHDDNYSERMGGRGPEEAGAPAAAAGAAAAAAAAVVAGAGAGADDAGRGGEVIYDRTGVVGGSGSGGSGPPGSECWRGGGSGALQALMVAATNERVACERGDWMENCESGDSGGGGGGCAGDCRIEGNAEEELQRAGEGAAAVATAAARGLAGGDLGRVGGGRGTKREWGGAGVKAEAFGGGDGGGGGGCSETGMGGGIGRRKRVSKAEAGMSILAQAAGILELESERSADFAADNNSNNTTATTTATTITTTSTNHHHHHHHQNNNNNNNNNNSIRNYDGSVASSSLRAYNPPAREGGGGGGGGGRREYKDNRGGGGGNDNGNGSGSRTSRSSSKNSNANGGGGSSRRRASNKDKSNTAAANRNGGRGGAYSRSMIDHGSTPPGSASPPPDASAPGGAGVAAGVGEGGAAGSGGGGGGSGAAGGVWRVQPGPATAGGAFGASRRGGGDGRGRAKPANARQDPPVAMGFAVAPGETVTVSTHRGSASCPISFRQQQQHGPGTTARAATRDNGYGNDNSDRGATYGEFSNCDGRFDYGRGGGGRGVGGGGGGGDGGERGSPRRVATEASPRSGWYVGPGGAYRRGLGSIPGPWRPYWKGQDGFALGGGEA